MSDDRRSTADMNDDRLSQALKALPREQAGLGFTARVLRRIENAPPWWSPARWLPLSWTARRFTTRRFTARHWTGMAAAAVLVLALGFGWREWHHRRAAASLQVLLAEKQELEAELEALRKLTADARPTVYLGGDGEVDLVLDLARFKREGGFGSRPSASEPTPAGSRPAIASPGAFRGEQAGQTVRPLRVVY